MNPDEKMLAQAIANTFERRGTKLPVGLPLALTEEFSSDASKQQQWKAFIQRAGVTNSARSTLKETVDDIRLFLMKAVK